jgi:proteasome assembly chaperone 2
MQKSGISAVVLLSGVNLLNRTDEQMLYEQFRLRAFLLAYRRSYSTPTYQMTLPNTDLSNTPLAQLSVLPIPQYSTPFSQNPRDVSSEPQLPFIPGGGLTRRILTSLPPSWSIPTIALLQFVLEGDNREDALMFASVIAKVVGIDSHIKDWKQPISWNQGLFGTPHDQSLYG